MYQKRFNELTTTELYQILKLRAKVFIVEQGQAYLDLDDLDYESIHFFLKQNDHIVSYLRILPKLNDYHQIGRVVSEKSIRHQGYARKLLNQAITYLKELYPNETLIIGAQEYLLDYYRSFGFIKYGSRYYEDNLPHFKMKLTL